MDRYCVVGNPIKHSLSPLIQNHFAKETNQELVYDKQLVEMDRFEGSILDLFKQGYKGCNVTVPFKEQAFAMCHELTERAKLAQSVNTLKYDAGKIFGDNTDGAGLVKDLTLGYNINLNNISILIIGAGGAAKGIVGSLLKENPSKLVIANRTYEKAEKLAHHFAHLGNVASCSIDHINDHYDLVINATSSSLKGELPLKDLSFIDQNTASYDLMYSSKPTIFMEEARKQGAKAMDGLGMLVEQAAESFKFWRGIEPSTLDLTLKIRQGL